MKKLVFAAVLLGSFTTVNGQVEDKMKKEGVVKGSIFKDGQEIEGYIKVKGQVYGSTTKEYYPAPWEFQDDIKFIPKDVFENTEKIKSKLYQKYGPKTIGGYRYENMEFESVKYADVSTVGLNMIAKWMFLRRIVDDKIAIFYHYDNPPSVVSGETFEQYYLECAKEKVVYRKGKEGKLKLVDAINGINMSKDWEDCPFVKEKQANGEYSGGRLEVRLQAIDDYNKNCK